MLVVCGRYVSQVLEEAKLMSQHARKKTIDVGDVRLGCLMLRERSWARPPGRRLISQLGRSKNSQALPVPGARLGLRLPPDRFSLTAPNFRSHTPPRPAQTGPLSLVQDFQARLSLVESFPSDACASNLMP